MWMFTVEELKCFLEAPCSEHGKIQVFGSIVSILEELDRLSNYVPSFLQKL